MLMQNNAVMALPFVLSQLQTSLKSGQTLVFDETAAPVPQITDVSLYIYVARNIQLRLFLLLK
jgi:hypothetical protein